MPEKRYTLKYFGNEVVVREFKCQCAPACGCGDTLQEAKQKMVVHYRKTADRIDSLSIEAFARWADSQ